MLLPRIALLFWVFLVHIAGIYLFTRGFLLSRLSLTDTSLPYCTAQKRDGQTCTIQPIPPTHKRAVLLIIDALRFDFIAPDAPSPVSPYHHNVFTLPAELTKKYPQHSFIFNAHADPPTTTLQRIKGITTGSLPTFVDIGSNFGAQEIEEDSLLLQMKKAGKKMAFMGDDTWMSVFPTIFEKNLTFPYDSFNVEDLHTVDNGVIAHLFPLLESSTPFTGPFDLLIGHFLGVDHVGHRVGPDHPSMKTKLQQMDDVVRRVVNELPEDTLLVVMGDHGMDRAGDHGGDGDLETSSGMWIYSKGAKLTDLQLGQGGTVTQDSIPSGLLQYKTFPKSTVSYRAIQQIDLVPTLSLLLGVPIPFNNLGTVIPELFWRGSSQLTPYQVLDKALQANAAQVMKYLSTYLASPSGSELSPSYPQLKRTYDLARGSQAGFTQEAHLVATNAFTRAALAACRAMWAQFEPVLMGFGLIVMGMGICAAWGLVRGVRAVWTVELRSNGSVETVDAWVKKPLGQGLRGIGFGISLEWVLLKVFGNEKLKEYAEGLNTLQRSIFFAALFSCAAVIISTPPLGPSSIPSLQPKAGSVVKRTVTSIIRMTPILLLAVSYLSNSFTFWESRTTPFLLASSLLPFLFVALRSPSAGLRKNILINLGILVFCIRAMSSVGVCREEMGGMCAGTFYASPSSWFSSFFSPASSSSTIPINATTSPTDPTVAVAAATSGTSSAPPPWALLLAPVVSYLLPSVTQRYLRRSKSQGGLARVLLPFIIRPVLMLCTLVWTIEYAESAGFPFLAGKWEAILRTIRTYFARTSVGWAALVGGTLWWVLPMCLDVVDIDVPEEPDNTRSRKQQEPKMKKERHLLGFGNAHGAAYLLFVTIPMSLVFLSQQLAGQVTFAFGMVGLMAYVEVLDSVRDVRGIENVFEAATGSNTTGLLGGSGSTSSPQSSSEASSSTAAPALLPPPPPLPSASDLIPLTLLSLVTYFATGHEATFPSLQWKTAFLLTKEVKYPWAPITVVLNTIGGTAVIGGIGVVLVGVWNRGLGGGASGQTTTVNGQEKSDQPPPAAKGEYSELTGPVLVPALNVMLQYALILLGTSVSAAVLRRHLMVWKVFAPRYMLAAVMLLAIDVGILIGVGLGLARGEAFMQKLKLGALANAKANANAGASASGSVDAPQATSSTADRKDVKRKRK
ncbi:hypothetical protein CVT24_011897 [Panaeolus cyanescens]|uniref:Uncharacterized protein n=1 Tax=Panaeolus cyanescens TaxID=181874 RepID=A0A409YNQ3_9AGAR|nr:hypothetical protein CVT24_011897 [Panaeolus cyanescens]